MGGVVGLQYLQARAVVVDAEAFACLEDARRLVAQRLQQPPDAVAVLGRADEDGADVTGAKLGH